MITCRQLEIILKLPIRINTRQKALHLYLSLICHRASDSVQRKTMQVSRLEWDYKRSLVLLVAQVGPYRRKIR
jgi:hypothetical protein